MPLNYHSHPSRKFVASLRASIANLETQTDSPADIAVVAEFKRILLLRIADLEAENESLAVEDSKVA
jgi:hypothetical protein